MKDSKIEKDKIIKHWIDSSIDDRRTMNALFAAKSYYLLDILQLKRY